MSKQDLSFYCETLAHLNQYAGLILLVFHDSISFFPKFSHRINLSVYLKPDQPQLLRLQKFLKLSKNVFEKQSYEKEFIGSQ